MADSVEHKPSRAFWVISAVALIWNILGILAYLGTVTLSPEALAAMPEAERALYTDVPAWATSAYAIAVFAGTMGCVGLLMRRAWAVPVLLLSLVGVVVQMLHAFFMTPMLEVLSSWAAVLPIIIVLVSAYLVWFGRSAREKGWLR